MVLHRSNKLKSKKAKFLYRYHL